MTRRNKAAGVGLACALMIVLSGCGGGEPLPPPPPPSPPPPPNKFYVINNVAQTLTCAAKAEGADWGNWFSIPAGKSWEYGGPGDTMSIQCKPPVQQVAYAIEKGERYSLLPTSGGAVALERIGY